MKSQGEFAMIGGPTIRPLVKSDPRLIALCPTVGAAIRQALIQSGIQNLTMAKWLNVSDGHMSNLQTNKKRVTVEQLRKIVLWTGCDLPAQKFCADCGGQFYFDPKTAEIAAHEAAILEIKARVA